MPVGRATDTVLPEVSSPFDGVVKLTEYDASAPADVEEITGAVTHLTIFAPV
jgi:hypothetical protein